MKSSCIWKGKKRKRGISRKVKEWMSEKVSEFLSMTHIKSFAAGQSVGEKRKLDLIEYFDLGAFAGGVQKAVGVGFDALFGEFPVDQAANVF